MVYHVKRTELILQDLHVNFDELTELQDSSVFKLEKTFVRPFERIPETVMALSIELELD